MFSEMSKDFSVKRTDLSENNSKLGVLMSSKMSTSSLSEFIRNASNEEKEEVYKKVMEKATMAQNKVFDYQKQEKSPKNG